MEREGGTEFLMSLKIRAEQATNTNGGKEECQGGAAVSMPMFPEKGRSCSEEGRLKGGWG